MKTYVGLPCTLNGFFATRYIGHLENNDSVSYAEFPSVDPFHYMTFKNYICSFLTSLEKLIAGTLISSQ
jgi:hypothetical protein